MHVSFGVLVAGRVTHVGGESKAEGDIAADIDTAVFLFIPTTLSEPEACATLPVGFGWCIGRACLDASIDESLLGVVVSFEELVPQETNGVDKEEGNNRSQANTRVS